MDALYLIFAAVAIVWGMAFVARGSLVVGCLVYLLSTVCFGYEFLHFDVGPLPLTIDRLVLVLVVGAYFIQRRLGRTDPKPLTKVDALLFVLLGVLAFSTFTHEWGATKAGVMPPVWRLILGYLMPASIYWVARQSRLTLANVRWTYVFLAGLGLYLGITAGLEITRQWSLVFPGYIANPELGLHFGRARGPFVHSVSMGLYLGVCLLATAMLWPHANRPQKLALLPLLGLILAAIFWTYTRSAWLGALAGCLSVVALVIPSRLRMPLIGAVAASVLLLAATQLNDLVGFERESSAADTRKSVSMRGSFTYVSWQMFLDRPLLGFGFGHFAKAKLPFLDDRSTALNLEAIREWEHHNTLLSLLTETGVIGLGLFLAVLVGWGWAAWQLSQNNAAGNLQRSLGVLFLGVLGVYVAPLVFHELSYSPVNNSLVFFLAGLMINAAHRNNHVAIAGNANAQSR